MWYIIIWSIVRSNLTKGPVLSEINRSTGALVSVRGRYMSPEERLSGSFSNPEYANIIFLITTDLLWLSLTRRNKPLYLLIQASTQRSIDGMKTHLSMLYRSFLAASSRHCKDKRANAGTTSLSSSGSSSSFWDETSITTWTATTAAAAWRGKWGRLRDEEWEPVREWVVGDCFLSLLVVVSQLSLLVAKHDLRLSLWSSQLLSALRKVPIIAIVLWLSRHHHVIRLMSYH